MGERGGIIGLIGSSRVAPQNTPRVRVHWGAGVEYRNLGPVELVEHAIRRGEGMLSATGALVVETGKHTGRSPGDKFIVNSGALAEEIWWGDVNHPMSPEHFALLHADILRHLAAGDRYRMDLSVGSDSAFRMPVRLITESAWSALFARNLFLAHETATTNGMSDWTVIHAPGFEANPLRHGTYSPTVIAIDFDWRRVLIAGTRYAGEIKKAMFTVMQGILPGQAIATMHCSANEGPNGDSALFFGLSGTGKTTLSMDTARRLIGDDEHGWTDRGIFNFEGGSYAKTFGLDVEKEPEIFQAAQRFGSVLENVALEPVTRRPLFDDDSLTENARAAFPISFFDVNAGGQGAHPKNVLFLSADAFGVLPPVAKLNPDQALYWFLSGYTSKLAGTERGTTSPSATFSTCFGAPFLPLPPMRYASLLAGRLNQHKCNVWLVNTGWTGGPYGVGERMPISLTRAIVAAILDGTFGDVAWDRDKLFGFMTPRSIPGAPVEQIHPREAWQDKLAFDATAKRLALDLDANFANFADVAPTIRQSGPAID